MSAPVEVRIVHYPQNPKVEEEPKKKCCGCFRGRKVVPTAHERKLTEYEVQYTKILAKEGKVVKT